MSDTEASADEINRDMETEEDSALDTEEEPGDDEDTDQEDPGQHEASPKLKKSPRPDPKKAKPAAKKAAPTSKAAPSGDGKQSKKTYEEMVLNAVKELKSRNGSSRVAILSYIKGAYNLEEVEDRIVGFHVSASIKRGLAKGHLKHATDAGKGKNCFKLDVKGLELLKAKAKPKAKSGEKKKSPSKSGTAKPKAKSKKEVVPALKQTSSNTAKNKLKASASRRSSIATPARVMKVNKVAEPKPKSGAKKEADKESAKAKKTFKAKEVPKKTSEKPDKKTSKSKPSDTKAKHPAKGKSKASSKGVDTSPPSKAKQASKKKVTKK